jgi:hypothetical protein
MIDSNWRRKNIASAFQMFSFLDDPGSRYRPSSSSLPIASAQDSYHHHSILLAPVWIAHRAAERLCLPDIPLAIDPECSALRQTISAAARRLPSSSQQLSPHSLARTHLSSTRVRSCFIRQLATVADLERAAMYASKSATRLSGLFPDDFFHILPLG